MEVWIARVTMCMWSGDLVSQTFTKTIHQLQGIRKFTNFDATKKEMHKHNMVPSPFMEADQSSYYNAS